MGLIESITRGAFGLRADVGGTPAPWDDYWFQPLGNASATGMRITAETSKRVAAVLACVMIKARNVGMMPCKIYTDIPGGGKKVVDHHPIYDVVYNRPNDQQTAFEFKQMMQAHVDLRGNGYAEILPGPRGAVDQLIPMHPDRVTVERLKPSGRLRYAYNDPLTNKTRYLMQEEVFRLSNFSDNGAVGQSTVALCCDTFGVAMAAQDYSARFFANDSRPGGIIEGTNWKTKEDEKRFQQNWQEAHAGRNRHKVATLAMGLTYKEIGVKPSDAQLLDARKFSRIEICSIFGVPPHLIGETEKTATYASVEQFNIMFAVQCILPSLVMWEQAIQRDLILNERYFAKFSMAALLRGDTASRYAAYHTAIGDGWLNQDEVRELEDLNPIPDGVGANYWRPVNWAPLAQLTSPAKATVPDVDTEESDDTSQPSNDDASGPAAHKGRLQLLAMSAAERCVRKEVAGVGKLLDADASPEKIKAFYEDHARFLVEVLKIAPLSAKAYVEFQAGVVCDQGRRALAITEHYGSIELAKMAAEEKVN